MDHGLSSVPKQHQGIWAEPCGGLHFVEGVMAGARDPELRRTLGPRLNRQRAIVFYRLGAEHEVYDRALAEAAPELVIPVLAQELKFYGHWLEAIGLMERDGLLVASDEQRARIAEARRLLAQTVAELKRRGAFAHMEQTWRTQHQLALDLTGDACHALHGLDLTQPPRE